MTWLSLVTTVSLVVGFVGMSLLGLLGLALRTQDARTIRPTWNRRMLTTAACFMAAAVVIPCVAVGGRDALFFGLGWSALATMVATMLSSRASTRLLGVMIFLSAALFSVVALPSRMGTVDVVGVFVAGGAAVAALTRMAARRNRDADPLRYS